jgi:hypothetical protein
MRDSASVIRRVGRKRKAQWQSKAERRSNPKPNESYYEELPVEEEIYLEKTEEELRSELISDKPRGD